MLIPIGFLAGLIALFVHAGLETSEVNDIVDTYLEHLRDDELDEAYAMLHPSRQATIDRRAFETAMQTPLLRRTVAFDWSHNDGPNGRGRACVIGGLRTDDEAPSVRFYLLEDDDGALRVLDVLVYEGVVPRGPFTCDGV
ncbi:MAG: hypothetical protein AB7S26_16375 [Sandaracinaceae bacterium]